MIFVMDRLGYPNLSHLISYHLISSNQYHELQLEDFFPCLDFTWDGMGWDGKGLEKADYPVSQVGHTTTWMGQGVQHCIT